MVSQKPSEGKKNKPRGRPFQKGYKRGKLENGVLADSGCASSDEGGIIALNRVKFNSVPLKEEGGYLVMETLDRGLKDAMSSPAEQKEEDENKIIETMDFTNGENTLSIQFSAVNNRRFRIQIFLNGDTEVRPVTYQGSTSGFAFWKLLKGVIKK